MELMNPTPAGIAIAAIFGISSAYFAYQQGRSPYLWFFIGLVLGFLGCVALLFLPQFKSAKNTQDAEDISPIYQLEPTHKLWYYLTESNEQMGPMSHNALVSAFLDKKISLSTYLWNEDMNEWQTLGQVIQTENRS